MSKKKKSSCHPSASSGTAGTKPVRAAAAAAKRALKSGASSNAVTVTAVPVSKAGPKPNPPPPYNPAGGKNGKVKLKISGFLPVADLPTPPLAPPPKITNPDVYARVYGGWTVKNASPSHPMELGGDKTLDFNIVLGIDRRCPDLPIWLANQLRMVLGTNTFLAVLCDRLNLTSGMFGPVVEAIPAFSKNPGVKCGHFEVFVMGLHESNGPAAVYKFLWSIFESYGPFIFDRLVKRFGSGRGYSASQVAKWTAALFNPKKEDTLDANEYTRLGPWLADALRMHGQEMGRPFELLERERTVGNATFRECAVIADTVAMAVAQAATAVEAKQAAVSEALGKLDFFGNHAVNLLYEYAEQCGVELEFSVGRSNKTDNVFTACVHWGNGDESKVIGRALRASSIESQCAAAVLAARKLNLSLTEYARSGRVHVIGTPLEGGDDRDRDYAVEIGPNGPVIVL